MTFDISWHLTFHDIWYFMTFYISWHLLFLEIWHLTFDISCYLTFHVIWHFLQPGNICQKIFQWQVACSVPDQGDRKIRDDDYNFFPISIAYRHRYWLALLSHSTDNLQLEQFATPDQICLWHGRFQSWSEKPILSQNMKLCAILSTALLAHFHGQLSTNNICFIAQSLCNTTVASLHL